MYVTDELLTSRTSSDSNMATHTEQHVDSEPAGVLSRSERKRLISTLKEKAKSALSGRENSNDIVEVLEFLQVL